MSDIPSVDEMEGFAIPSIEEMELRAPRKRAKRAPKPKPPCKYGPRGVDGYCPKKPKAPPRAKQLRVRDYSSVTAAGRQAGEVLRSEKATGAQKREAVGVLGEAIAVESGKKVASSTYREAKKALRTKEGKQAVRQLGQVAKPLAKATVVGAGIAATLAVGGELLDANRLREAEAFGTQQLKLTEKRLNRRLTDDEAETLYKQYVTWYYKQPVKNTFLGK